MKDKYKKEYEKYMNEQLALLTRHFQTIMLRIHNKYMELSLK